MKRYRKIEKVISVIILKLRQQQRQCVKKITTAEAAAAARQPTSLSSVKPQLDLLLMATIPKKTEIYPFLPTCYKEPHSTY